MKKQKTNVFILRVVLIVLAVLAAYFVVSNRAKKGPNAEDGSEVDKLLNYDFTDQYPKTVKETVRLHCRYMKCAYNNEFTEEELKKANQQIRNLYDDELLDYNEESAQLASLKEDIQYYADNKQKIISYSFGEDSQIEYNTEKNIDYAKIKVTVLLRKDSSSAKGQEEYILRKNDNGEWKILGWQAVKDSSTEDKGDAK
ncbi:putative uncharacterized protein [Clostridium sp. CAG:590]|nr:putative uncharacterized protein [Clostridium sp. CAG:590]